MQPEVVQYNLWLYGAKPRPILDIVFRIMLDTIYSAPEGGAQPVVVCNYCIQLCIEIKN